MGVAMRSIRPKIPRATRVSNGDARAGFRTLTGEPRLGFFPVLLWCGVATAPTWTVSCVQEHVHAQQREEFMNKRWLKAVAGLAIAVAAATGVGHNAVPTPAANRCVQIVRVS